MGQPTTPPMEEQGHNPCIRVSSTHSTPPLPREMLSYVAEAQEVFKKFADFCAKKREKARNRQNEEACTAQCSQDSCPFDLKIGAIDSSSPEQSESESGFEKKRFLAFFSSVYEKYMFFIFCTTDDPGGQKLPLLPKKNPSPRH